MSKIISGSFKPKKVYFSQVSNHALRDNKLSLKAKGLYALIQSYITIENFVLYKNTLKKACSEGNTSFESGWKELKDKGYLVQEKHQSQDGTFYYLYDLLDIPDSTPEVHTPKTEGVDSASVDNAHSGKVGVYNKIDLKNTDLNNTNPKDTDKYKIYKGYSDEQLGVEKPYDYNILNRQIDKVFKDEYEDDGNGLLTKEDIKHLFVRFYEIGGYRRGIEPTRLKNEQVEYIVNSLMCAGDGKFSLNADSLEMVMEEYFKQTFKDCDYSINHFVSGEIIMLRCYELNWLGKL